MKTGTIRWDELRERLRASERSTEEALAASPERMRAVFHARAVRLAQATTDRKTAAWAIPAVLFRLGPEQYAIELKELAEVTPFRNCTPIPGSSPLFPGVLNLRGELRPVIDLGRALCGSVAADSGAALVLRRPVALRVDSVDGLRELDAADLTGKAEGRYLRGQTSGGVGLLDMEALLSALFSRKESHSK